MDSDAELVASYLDGHEPAFGRLVSRHMTGAYSFALRYVGNAGEADDIVQESFVKVWQNLSRYDATAAGFKTWLMRIVRNTCVDHLRKKKALPFSAFETDEGAAPFAELPDDATGAEELLARKDDAGELMALLQKLPTPYREVLLMYYGEDMTFEQVATALDTPVNTVKSRHRRALHRLRDMMRI